MKLVLLDRDGVINIERRDFVKSPEELIIFPRALEALALFKSHGFACAITTNQSCIGRGMLSIETLERIHQYLCATIAAHGGEIAQVFFCPDHPDHATYRRKPKPGMLLEALEKFGATPEKTPMVGDTLSDMEAALAAGCPRYLVQTGLSSAEAVRLMPEHLKPVTICTDILDAAQRIVTMV